MSEKNTFFHKLFKSCSLNHNYFMTKKSSLVSYDDACLMTITDKNTFDKAVSQLFSSRECEYMSERHILIAIRRVLCECEDLSISRLHERVNCFLKILNEYEILEFNVFKSLYGAKIEEIKCPLRLGPFVVYNFPYNEDEVEKTILLPKNMKFTRGQHKDIVISCKVRAKDYIKALDIANDLFNKFDLFVAFLLAEEYLNYSCGILRIPFIPYQKAIIYSELMVGGPREVNSNFSSKLEIENLSRFIDNITEEKFDVFLNFVMSPETKIEKKISTSIEWIGESYADRNRPTSFIKAVIALEALLKTEEQGIITPSIMSSIAEQCAFLNGKSTEECIEIERNVKKIYTMRSKITHTGVSSVSFEFLRETRAFIRSIILQFVRFIEDQNISEVADFLSALRKKKYQQGGLMPKDD